MHRRQHRCSLAVASPIRASPGSVCRARYGCPNTLSARCAVRLGSGGTRSRLEQIDEGRSVRSPALDPHPQFRDGRCFGGDEEGIDWVPHGNWYGLTGAPAASIFCRQDARRQKWKPGRSPKTKIGERPRLESIFFSPNRLPDPSFSFSRSSTEPFPSTRHGAPLQLIVEKTAARANV